MKRFIRKSGLFLGRAFLSLCAVLLIALIAIQIVLIAGINIFSTGKGSSFVERQINNAITDSGYNIAFDKIYYDPMRGFTLYGLIVSDEQGPFVSLDRFSLGVSFAQIPLKKLELSAHGGSLTLMRLPETPEEEIQETKKEITPFPVPDIYFKIINVQILTFESIILSEDVAGNPLSLSPVMRARAELDDVITATLQLSPGMKEIAPNLPAPDNIELSAIFAPQTLDLTLQRVVVNTDVYKIESKGAINLAENGAVDLTLDAAYNDLTLLTQNAIERADLAFIVKGPRSGPALDVTGKIYTGSLKEKGLDDIDISIDTADISQGMKGLLSIATSYRDQAVVIESDISYDAPLLTLSKLKGTAPHLSLNGGGNYSMETGLVDVEVALSADDLSHYKDLIGAEIAGTLDASAALKPAGEEQSAQISATLKNASYDKIKVRRLSAKAALPSIRTPWPQSADIDMQSLSLADGVSFDKIAATLNQDEANAERYALSLNGNGTIPSAVSFNGKAFLTNLTEPVPTAQDINFFAKIGASNIALTGAFFPENVDLKIVSNNFRGTDIPAQLPPALNDMRINAEINLTGNPASPFTQMAADLKGIGADEYGHIFINIKAKHENDALNTSMSGRGTGIRSLSANIDIPLTFSLLPFQFHFNENAQLTGTINADANLATLSPLFIPPTQSLSGSIAANGTIAGTIASPEPSGNIHLSGGAYQDNGNGIFLYDLSASASFTANSITLNSLVATDGKDGRLSGSGSLSFAGDDANIGLRTENFNIPQSNLADGIVNADLRLNKAGDGLALTGNVGIDEMHILIPESFQSKIPQLNIVEKEKEKKTSAFETIALNIKIDAPNQVFVRGWGLDAEFGGAIEVSGHADAPQLHGNLSARRGRYEEFGKRFDLAKADLRFQGDTPPSPYLDIDATTPAGEVTASVLLTGPVTSPSIKFSSSPALPEDEVVSRILFGKDSTRISPFQAVQLTQTIQRFSGKGGGGFDPMGMLRSATDFDDISVELDDEGQASVGVGRYLTDNVYLELGKGSAENSGAANIQIEVTPSINVESRIGEQTGGGVFWRRDY